MATVGIGQYYTLEVGFGDYYNAPLTVYGAFLESHCSKEFKVWADNMATTLHLEFK